MQINKRSLNTNDIRNVRELEEKQQEIKRFMLDVLEDAYWKELANMPEDQRHIDDWDFFLVAERKITMDYLLYEIFDVAAGMAFSVPLIFISDSRDLLFKKMMTETKI